MPTSNQPSPIATSTEDAPLILLPSRSDIFLKRAQRFEQLSHGHALGAWLSFLGHLTQAQHQLLHHPNGLFALSLSLPDHAELDLALKHGMPPLNPLSITRPNVWRDCARQLARAVEGHAPEASRSILRTLADTSDTNLENLAHALLNNYWNAEQPGLPESLIQNQPATLPVILPIIAAALQVTWTALAAELKPEQLQIIDTPGICPCCGSLPVASLIRLSPSINNLRYLHCSLCNTEWNLPRATCTSCGSDRNLSLQQIQNPHSSGQPLSNARAETCDDCKSYLKMFYQEHDANVDPVADDLATLALDLLVDEAGYQRSGPNWLLINGIVSEPAAG